MEQKDKNTSLSIKIYFAVMQETAKKYAEQAAAMAEASTDQADTTEALTETTSTKIDGNPFVSPIPAEPKRRKSGLGKIIGLAAAIVLLIGGLALFFSNNASTHSDNNPLGIQIRSWEKFVRITSTGVKLYKEADTKSPNLRTVSTDDGCMGAEELRWKGEKTPRGWEADDYFTNEETILPVVDESEDWYKVYVGTDRITEAYLQKANAEEITPEPITKEVLDKLYDDNNPVRLVKKGEFTNLYLHYAPSNDYYGPHASVGVLLDGCLYLPKGSMFHPELSENKTAKFFDASTGDSDSHWWNYDAPQSYWKESSWGYSVLDVNKIEDTDLRQIVTNLTPSGEVHIDACYYFPTVFPYYFCTFEYTYSTEVTSKD